MVMKSICIFLWGMDIVGTVNDLLLYQYLYIQNEA